MPAAKRRTHLALHGPPGALQTRTAPRFPIPEHTPLPYIPWARFEVQGPANATAREGPVKRLPMVRAGAARTPSCRLLGAAARPSLATRVARRTLRTSRGGNVACSNLTQETLTIHIQHRGPMNTRVATCLYLAAWLVFVAALVAGLSYAGLALWLSAALGYLFFVAVNATLAYRHRSYQLALQGRPAPSYLRYLLVGERSRREFVLPRPIRWLLALVIGAGGLGFVAVAVVIAVSLASQDVPSPAAAVALPLLLALMGLGFAFVAVRLALVKDNERLFSHPALRTFRRGDGI